MTTSFQQLLPSVRECFAQFPISKACVFGSFSRGEERTDSDVDFIVEYCKEDGLSLMTTARLYRALRNILNRDIDIVEDGYLMPYAEKRANDEKILIYERETA